MEIACFVTVIGVCVRIARGHDERDRLTILLLERISRFPLYAFTNLFQPDCRCAPCGLYRQKALALKFLEGIGLLNESFTEVRLAKCLARCVAKKWAVCHEVTLYPLICRDYTLTITQRGLDHLGHLHTILPPPLPAARLHSH